MKKSSSHLSRWRALGQGARQFFWGGLLLVGAAQTAMAQTANASIDTFGEPFTTALRAPAEQTRVLVYRTNQALSSLPVNIYLNGQYHASLLRGGFTEFCTAPGAVSVKAALDDASRLHLSKLDTGQRMTMQAGQTVFLKLDETGQPALALLNATEKQAKIDMSGTRRQIHTISRAKAAVACAEPAQEMDVPMAAMASVTPKPAKPLVPREYALETDALFEFGKAELRASGFNAIETLVQRLHQDFTSVERIRVVGYTDAIGSAAFNKKLSQQRAEVVSRQIAGRHVQPERGIEAEGRGAIELAKTGCRNAPTPENKICHAPNRRVVVVITGARR